MKTGASHTSIPRWLWGLTALCLAIIFITALSAGFSRPAADDYAFAAYAETHDVIAAVMHWYNTWTGSYSSMFMHSLLAQFPAEAIGMFLGALVLLWWGGTWWLVYEISLRLQWERPRTLSFIVAAVLCAAVIDSLPNIYDTFYWISGALAHVASLVGTIYFLAALFALARHQLPRGWVTLFALLTVPYMLFIGGFSSPSGAFLVTLLVILNGLWWRLRRRVHPVLPIALFAALIALYLIAAAPGTDIRQAAFPPAPSLSALVAMTAAFVGFAHLELLLLAPFSLAFLLVFMGWLGYQLHTGDAAALRRRRWQVIGAFFLLGAVLIAAPVASAAYAMSRYLPARANTTPLYTLVLVTAACAYVAGAALRLKRPSSWRVSRPLLAVLGALMVLGPVQTLRDSLHQMENMRTFNREWYVIHAQLQAAVARGETEVTVTPFTFDLGNMIQGAPPQDPYHPQVRTYGNLAQYYGLERVMPQGAEDQDSGGA